MNLQLIVGLGNRGDKYRDTRHNAGFWFITALAQHLGVALTRKARFHGAVARYDGDGYVRGDGSGGDGGDDSHGNRGDCDGNTLWLLQPMTMMNLSGVSVATLAGYYRIAPAQILIAHDEIDIAAGDVRLKRDGGAAGHNGLRDIINHLGARDFWRLRLGVGHPGRADEVVSYVLRPPLSAEREAIDKSIAVSLTQFSRIYAGKFEEAMNVLHNFKGVPAGEARDVHANDVNKNAAHTNAARRV